MPVFFFFSLKSSPWNYFYSATSPPPSFRAGRPHFFPFLGGFILFSRCFPHPVRYAAMSSNLFPPGNGRWQGPMSPSLLRPLPCGWSISSSWTTKTVSSPTINFPPCLAATVFCSFSSGYLLSSVFFPECVFMFLSRIPLFLRLCPFSGRVITPPHFMRAAPFCLVSVFFSGWICLRDTRFGRSITCFFLTFAFVVFCRQFDFRRRLSLFWAISFLFLFFFCSFALFSVGRRSLPSPNSIVSSLDL